VLASHPTPPVFNGSARRNARRNHDEVRFWVDYLNHDPYIEDDSGRGGGLVPDASFVLVGDLNADPDDKSPFRDAIRSLLRHPRVHAVRPTASVSDAARDGPLDPDDTARWGKRVDYVLPSADLVVDTSGVARPSRPDSGFIPISDHFPVWVDLRIPVSSQ
jgi:endonuclease/exonuclease/phosphatase family metal-dependent hydrolase